MQQQGMIKPTLIIFVANFQAVEASFWKLSDAFDEVQACKDAGAWITTVIVDPIENRQPRVRADVVSFANHAKTRRRRQISRSNRTITQENLITLRRLISERNNKDVISDKSYYPLLRKKVSEAKEDLLKSVVRTNDKRLNNTRFYKDLTTLFAQQIASRPEDGFKVSNYTELVRPPVASNFKRLIQKTSLWFGDGEINSTCPNSKHLSDRAIWSPGYFRAASYPEGIHCQWMIRTRPGYFVYLKFDFFNTEDTFDPVTVYETLREKEEDIIVTLSGYFSVYDLPEVNSTGETMMVDFKSDGGSSYTGFHATWTAEIVVYTIKSAELVYSVDVSASLRTKDLHPVKEWIKLSTSYFQFNSRPKLSGNKKKFSIKRKIPIISKGSSRFGILTFDSKGDIVSSVEDDRSKEEIHQLVDSLNHTKGKTFIGEAYDFARFKQFRLLLEDMQSQNAGSPMEENSNGKLISGDGPECNNKKVAPKILFLFSDIYSLDDPYPAANRLCEEGILPVVIRIGRVNLRGVQEATGRCGISFSINVPIPEVMLMIKCKLGLLKNDTEPTTTASLTTGEPAQTVRPTTTRTTTPPLPRTIYLPPYMRRLNYFGVAGLLIAIGIIQGLVLCSILYFNCFITPYILIHSVDSEESLLTEDIEHGYEDKMYDEDVFDEPTPVNSFFTRHAAEEAEVPYEHSFKRLSNFEKNRKCCGEERVVPYLHRKHVPDKFQ